MKPLKNEWSTKQRVVVGGALLVAVLLLSGCALGLLWLTSP